MSEPVLGPVRLVAEPKQTGGVRWLARLDDETAERYAAAVVPLVPTIESALPSSVVANRVTRWATTPPSIGLEPWRSARSRFRRDVRTLARGMGAAVMADVRDCYGSIAPATVERALRALGGGRGAVGAVMNVLTDLAARGVRGLPVGPEPSAVLANAVLLGVDRRLAEEGFAHLRWVDDVIVFVPDAGAADRALGALTQTVGSLGLQLARDKTRLVIDPAAIRGGGAMSGPRRRPARTRG